MVRQTLQTDKTQTQQKVCFQFLNPPKCITNAVKPHLRRTLQLSPPHYKDHIFTDLFSGFTFQLNNETTLIFDGPVMVLLPRFCCIIKKWIPASDSPLHCRKRQITVKLWDLQAQNTTRAEVWRWHYKINQSNNQWTSIINSLLIRFNRENLVTIFKDVRWKWLMIEIRDLNMYLCKFLAQKKKEILGD